MVPNQSCSRERILHSNKNETDEVMDIMFAMEQEFEERENEAKQDFQSLRDEIKNKVIMISLICQIWFIVRPVRSITALQCMTRI